MYTVFNLDSIEAVFHQAKNHEHVMIFIFLPERLKRAEGAFSTRTGLEGFLCFFVGSVYVLEPSQIQLNFRSSTFGGLS